MDWTEGGKWSGLESPENNMCSVLVSQFITEFQKNTVIPKSPSE